MDEEILKQIFDELFSSLEPLETQNAALLQLLKTKGIATSEELAPFLEAAGNASNVRWRAARIRTEALISSALRPPEKSVEAAAPERKESHGQASGEADNGDNKKAQSKTEKSDAAGSDNARPREGSKQEASQKDASRKEGQRKEDNREEGFPEKEVSEKEESPQEASQKDASQKESQPKGDSRQKVTDGGESSQKKDAA